MVSNKKHIAYDVWENFADIYAEQVGSKPHNAYLDKPATISLIPDIYGKNVLDAGCGPGLNSQWLAEHGAKVIAVDASPKMVKYTKKRLGNQIKVKVHDLRNPLVFIKDNTLDLVLASLVLDYIEDWIPVFNDFHRILKEKGILVFSVGHPFIDFSLKEDPKDYFKVERCDMWWKTWGKPFIMPSFRRPLGYITDTLKVTNFLIEKILETRPTLQYLEADPEGYEKASKRPTFLSIKAIASKKC